MAEAQKPGQRVILEFDREVTEEQVREMQAAHNATDAFLETAGGHHHHDDDDEETAPEEEPE